MSERGWVRRFGGAVLEEEEESKVERDNWGGGTRFDRGGAEDDDEADEDMTACVQVPVVWVEGGRDVEWASYSSEL